MSPARIAFLDSTLSIDAIVALAQRHGFPAIALVDIGNLHGAVEFTLAAKRAGIRPILGAKLNDPGQQEEVQRWPGDRWR